MRIGIVGLPYTGKTTVFNAITGMSAPTGKYSDTQGEMNRAVTQVPDDRLSALAAIYHPKKITMATIEFCDVGGLKKGASGDAGLSAFLLGQLRDMEALAVVVRIFERASVPHPDNCIDPAADLETLLSEFILEDLAIAEKRYRKVGESLGKGTQEDREKLAFESRTLERMIAALTEGRPVRGLEMSPEEEFLLRSFGFLSQKPVLVLANVGDFTSEIEQQRLDRLTASCDSAGLKWIALNGDLECELRSIEDPEEQKEFMDAMGVKEHASGAVIRAAYDVTHSATFLTAGEKEVRAWEILEGSRAVEAAAKIHTDIARGFIRAEVVPYEHLIAAGSIAGAREAGHYREEGRDAIIHEGDVILFRFNV